MGPEEMLAALVAIGVTIDDVVGGQDPREWDRTQIDAAVSVWAALDQMVTNLEVVRRDHGIVLAKRLPDEYRSAAGVTVHRTIPKTEAWDGSAVLDELGQPVIDKETGEQISAIPVDVARDVLPACGQGATSSKWKVTELRKVLPGVEKRHRSVTYGDAIIQRGPLPYQARRSRRVTPE